MTQEEIKVRLFEAIANNSRNLCDNGEYMKPGHIAYNVNKVYDMLFKQKTEE